MEQSAIVHSDVKDLKPEVSYRVLLDIFLSRDMAFTGHRSLATLFKLTDSFFLSLDVMTLFQTVEAKVSLLTKCAFIAVLS